MNTLGTELKNLRGQQNLTQSEAAKKIGIEQSFLSKLESDQSWASVDVLRRICAAYRIRPAQLLSQVDSDCLRGNVNYQSLLVNARKRKIALLSCGALLATLVFGALWWNAAQGYIRLPGLISVHAQFPLISMKFEQIPAVNAIQLIAEHGNLTIKNIELAESKLVTINVSEVAWPDALAIVADQVNLNVIIDGSIVTLQKRP